MQTLADLKRRITPGVKIKLVDCAFKPHKFMGVVRTVKKVQTNGFYMATDEQMIQTTNGSWLDYPKAGQFKPVDDKTFRIITPNEFAVNGFDFLEYTFV